MLAYSIKDKNEMDTAVKLEIFNLLNCDIKSGGERHSVSYAIERMVASFLQCCYGESTDLVLPVLLPLTVHCYE